MNSIRPIFVLMALAFYRWARAEIDPLHPDLPYVLNRIAELEGACRA